MKVEYYQYTWNEYQQNVQYFDKCHSIKFFYIRNNAHI